MVYFFHILSIHKFLIKFKEVKIDFNLFLVQNKNNFNHLIIYKNS